MQDRFEQGRVQAEGLGLGGDMVREFGFDERVVAADPGRLQPAEGGAVLGPVVELVHVDVGRVTGWPDGHVEGVGVLARW